MMTSKDFSSSETMVYASGSDNRNNETRRYPSPKRLAETGIRFVKEEAKVSAPVPETSR